jgi:hypothetical protein
MTAIRKFYNVTIVQTTNDEGYTLTFDSETAAKDIYDWAIDNGFWFVDLWS